MNLMTVFCIETPHLNRSFGFTNVASLQMGRVGRECRGEEHEVELVWSLKSSKTRVYWNKRNITNLIQQEVGSSSVQMSWLTHTGERLQVVAHAEAIPGVAQYDLLIDGVSFHRMPDVAELGQWQSLVEASESSDLSDDSNSVLEAREYTIKRVIGNSRSEHVGSSGSELDSFQEVTDHGHGEGLGYRLSMVGLNSSRIEVDELHSEVYSPMLESLRQRIVECLPQTEEIISRSIIHTFFPDYVSLSHHSLDVLSSKSLSNEEKEPQQIEVDALCEAYEWTRFENRATCLSSIERPNAIATPSRARSAPSRASDQKRLLLDSEDDCELNYMQKLVDFIFIRVRNEDVASDEGARILLGVAAVLRLDFAQPLPTDTVLLDNLDASIAVEDLARALSTYGDLEAVAISSIRPSFGFCRFMSEDGFRRLLEADATGSFEVSGLRPNIIPLTENMYSRISDPGARDCRPHSETRSLSPTPSQSSARGQPNTIPHLMGAWTGDDDEEGELAEPSEVRSGLKRSWEDNDSERKCAERTEPAGITPDFDCREVIQQRTALSSPRSSITDLEDLVDA